jgi:hypothetical protein
VQVGEQHVVRAQQRYLDRLRLLDLDDHLGLCEDRLGAGDDPGALGKVVVVGDGRAEPGALLDDDLVAVVDQLADACRRDGDPVFVGLDLGGDTDPHAVTPTRWASR